MLSARSIRCKKMVSVAVSSNNCNNIINNGKKKHNVLFNNKTKMRSVIQILRKLLC